MQDHLCIHVRPEPAGEVVQLTGIAGLTRSEELRLALRPVVDRRPPRVVIDLSQLQFINSLGLGVLIQFRHDLVAAGSELRLAAACERVAEILRKTRLVDLFPLYPSAELALST